MKRQIVEEENKINKEGGGGGKRATLCDESRKLINMLTSDSEGPGSVTG